MEYQEIEQALALAGKRAYARAFFDHGPDRAAMYEKRRDVELFMGAHPFPAPAAFFMRPGWVKRFAYAAQAAGGIALTLGGFVYAAQASLPGDALYPVKRSMETMALAVAQDPHAKTALHLKFADRRMDELAEISSHADEQVTHEIGAIISDYSSHMAAAEQGTIEMPATEGTAVLMDRFQESSTRGEGILDTLAQEGNISPQALAQISLEGGSSDAGAGDSSSWLVAYNPPAEPAPEVNTQTVNETTDGTVSNASDQTTGDTSETIGDERFVVTSGASSPDSAPSLLESEPVDRATKDLEGESARADAQSGPEHRVSVTPEAQTSTSQTEVHDGEETTVSSEHTSQVTIHGPASTVADESSEEADPSVPASVSTDVPSAPPPLPQPRSTPRRDEDDDDETALSLHPFFPPPSSSTTSTPPFIPPTTTPSFEAPTSSTPVPPLTDGTRPVSNTDALIEEILNRTAEPMLQ